MKSVFGLRSLAVMAVAIHIWLSAGRAFGGIGVALERKPGPKCSYTISMVLHEDKQKVTATTCLTYRNYSGVSLETLVFRFTPTRPATRDTSPESFSIESSGTQLEVQPHTGPNGAKVPEHFVVKLQNPVATGQIIDLAIHSTSAVKDRYGIKYLEGCWHPKVVRRQNNAWQIGIEEFADYRVTIGPLDQPLIPTSGVPVARRQDNGRQWTTTYETHNIPSFGMVFSHANHVVSGRTSGIDINCFYVKDKKVARRMLGVAKDVIQFYRKMYGFYPDTVLNLIAFDGSGFGGGPIGSNIVHVNKTFDHSEDGTIWAIAHEIAHEYWGWNHVIPANPEVHWLCLGMGLWSDRQYMDAEGREGRNSSILRDYLQAASRGLNTRLDKVTREDRKNRMDENDLAHSKGYAIAMMLEYVLGKQTFREVARVCLERFANQPIDIEGFRSICEEQSGAAMEWFFDQWVLTNDTLDYAVNDVQAGRMNGRSQFVVSIEPKGRIEMPIDVRLEYIDGSEITNRVAQRQRQSTFPAKQTWRRVTLDPDRYLADLDRSNNCMTNADSPPAFEVLDIDLGDKAWGLNLLKVRVKNATSRKRSLYVHIGGRVPNSIGFGMGELYTIPANATKWIRHWYWIPPGHGTFEARVSFADPINPSSAQYEKSFLRKTFPITFPIPNDRCNNLIITDKLPDPTGVYEKLPKHLEPLKHFATEHFVFYCSPGTPAYTDMDEIIAQRESALRQACEFVGTEPTELIIVFFYPDQITKRMCTLHIGQGLARGNTIVEVYNDKVKLDPYHETIHILMRSLGNPPALFNEGFTVYMSERLGNSALEQLGGGESSLYARAKELKGKNDWIPLEELITYTEIGSKESRPPIAYAEAGSFVKFLVETFGRETFLKAYSRLKNSGDAAIHAENQRTLEKLYGQSLEEMESQWETAFQGGHTVQPATVPLD